MAKNEVSVVGDSVPNLPWEERPAGSTEVMWRYTKNPVIDRNPLPDVPRIYNSAAMPYKGEFVGVFRCDHRSKVNCLHMGWSKDGLAWEFAPDPITFDEPIAEYPPTALGYDPRLIRIDDTYYINWCAGYGGPTIGMACSKDLKTFTRLENATVPYNRNGVLFPRKIGGKFAMLHRPCGPGHCNYGNTFYSESPDLVHWGRHREVMRTAGGWESTKVGPGPAPIETSEGWLMIYHGVITTCNGYVYSMGGAILDLDEPWKVKARAKSYIFTPEAHYETCGFVPNVTFPCTAMCDADTGRIAVYYGAADTYLCLAFARTDELIAFIRKYAGS